MENDAKTIGQLLSHTAILSKKYEDMARITGGNFNIFSIMGMESNERYTHSALIGELLNPKGSHGQGAVFLKAFFETIAPLARLEHFDFDNAQIILEEFIGTRSQNQGFSGYIDIVVKHRKQIVVIENKIYAGDQFEQLKRYKNYYPEAILLYLNLDGKLPDGHSAMDLEIDKDFHIITYRDQISQWLEKCHKEAVQQPILRETIKQYANLVKKLTNQTPNDAMSQEIIQLIKNDLKSANQIAVNFEKAKSGLLAEVRDRVFEKLSVIHSGAYELSTPLPIDSQNTSICLKPLQHTNQTAFFCLQSFSGKLSDGQLFGSKFFIGILDYWKKSERFFMEEKKQSSITQTGWWWEIERIENFEGFPLDFSNLDFLQYLVLHPLKIEELAQHIADPVSAYIKNNEGLLARIHDKMASSQ